MDVRKFEERLREHKGEYAPVVPFASSDKFLLMDFTEANEELTDDILENTDLFSQYVNKRLDQAGARYGIGGYDEHRSVYSRSRVFDSKGSAGARRLHLGIDIWGAAGTPVYAPLPAVVHSVAFNDAFGDYGATLVLQHELDDVIFHTLYGHLSLASIQSKQEGQTIEAGEWIAAFGEPAENGQWPPHLHFQLIKNMEGMKGDYPGVCALSEREKYLANCFDPDLLLGMMQYAGAE